MAERRMFSKKIVDTDAFLDMPMSTRLLYYDLALRADDDGFIASPKKITRTIGCSEDDLKLLILKQFIIPFDSGICVIKDWRIHNYIQKDRYHETQYVDEKKQLKVEKNGSYTKCIHNVYKTDTEVRLELELGKDRLELVPPIIPPKDETNAEDSGESLEIETVSDQKSHSTTPNRKRRATGKLTPEQQKRFEIFWSAWPNKKSPGQAESTFAKLDPSDDVLQEILAGIERAKKYDHRFKSLRFTPYPSTWLNNKGWLDEFGGDVSNEKNIGDPERYQGEQSDDVPF